MRPVLCVTHSAVIPSGSCVLCVSWELGWRGGEGRGRGGEICDAFMHPLPQGVCGVELHNEAAGKLLHYVKCTE